MKKIIALATCVLLICGSAFAQNYKHAVGVRFGGMNAGLTYKQHLNKGNAVEAMLWFNYKAGFSVAGLYEWTTPVINKDFNLYYGVGGHLGAYRSAFALGIDAIVGLEYKIPNVPLAFSIDYKPALNFLPSVTFDAWDFALGIKFTF